MTGAGPAGGIDTGGGTGVPQTVTGGPKLAGAAVGLAGAWAGLAGAGAGVCCAQPGAGADSRTATAPTRNHWNIRKLSKTVLPEPINFTGLLDVRGPIPVCRL